MVYETMGTFFIGLGFLIFLAILALILGEGFLGNLPKKYRTLEMAMLNKFAKLKDFDLIKEELEEKISRDKSFKKVIQEEMLKEYIYEKENKKK